MNLRIHVDFNNRSADDKVGLNTVGSLADIAKASCPLTEGMTVILYDEELEVDATLFRSEHGPTWLGLPDWSSRRPIC